VGYAFLLGSFFEINQHHSKAFNAIRYSKNHMTDSSGLPGFLQIIFCEKRNIADFEFRQFVCCFSIGSLLNYSIH
jgi:hypothetical protein